MDKNSSPKVSVVICSLGREKELQACLESLYIQEYKNYEIEIVKLEMPLVLCRQIGLQKALDKGAEIVSFIDDDVICSRMWLHNIVHSFRNFVNTITLTRPKILSKAYQKNRYIFNYNKLYSIFNNSKSPGNFSKWGAPSMASNYDFTRNIFCEVSYLECCNMSFKASVFNKIGGFDLRYEGTGEWSEVDLSIRARKYGDLIFNGQVQVFHCPTQAGVYKNRLKTDHRYRSYIRFADRHLKKTWQLFIYKKLFWLYLKWKEWKSENIKR